jgi:hypothetical protein
VGHDAIVGAHSPVGVAPYSPISHDVTIASYLPAGVAPYSPTGHDVILSVNTPVGAVPLSTISHDALVAGFEPVGATPFGAQAGQQIVVGFVTVGPFGLSLVTHDAILTATDMPAGAGQGGSISHVANVGGFEPVGVTPYASAAGQNLVTGLVLVGAFALCVSSMNVVVTGNQPAGVAPFTDVIHNAVIPGLTAVGSTQGAQVDHSISLSGVPIGVDAHGAVSHVAQTLGLVTPGTANYGPVSTIIQVLASVGCAPAAIADALHRVTVAGYVPVGVIVKDSGLPPLVRGTIGVAVDRSQFVIVAARDQSGTATGHGQSTDATEGYGP